MIEVIIKIVLKPDSGVDRGKTQIKYQEGQLKLTWINVWIKIIIITGVIEAGLQKAQETWNKI